MRATVRRNGAPRTPGGAETALKLDFSFGEDFSATLISSKLSSWSWSQSPFEFDACRRVEPPDAHRLQPLGEALEIVLERAERQEAVLLARSLADRAPEMGMAVGLHRQLAARLADLEPEVVVERLRDREVGDEEVEPVERMDAELAGAPDRLDGPADRGHGHSSLV